MSFEFEFEFEFGVFVLFIKKACVYGEGVWGGSGLFMVFISGFS